MLHSHDFGRELYRRRFLNRRPDPKPLSAAGYLVLRRKAAGLTQQQLADRLIALRAQLLAAGDAPPIARTRAADMLDFVRMLEAPATRARLSDTLDAIAAVIPFDTAVYYQLANAKPQRHPRVCRGCGCSQQDACEHEHLGACAWSTTTSCTHCDPKGEGL